MKLDLEATKHTNQLKIKYKLIPWLVLITGLILTYVLQQAAFYTIQKTSKIKFDFQARETVSHIEQRLSTNKQILLGTTGLFMASKNVERNEFHKYVEQLRLPNNYPGIQGIGFALMIPFREKSRHINTVRKEGFPEYNIFPFGDRDVYTPAVYLEPFTVRNQRAFGYDMYSEPIRHSAMEQARDSGEATITSKIRLTQETGQENQTGFMMYLPVYHVRSTPETEAERHVNIVGWIYSPFLMNDLMQGILGQNNNIEFQIFDGKRASPETLMYPSVNELPSSENSSTLFHTSQLIHICGHPWTVKLRSLPDLQKQLDNGKTDVIRLSGILLSMMLAAVLWQLNGRTQALAFAWNTTAELQESENRAKTAFAELKHQKYALDQHAIVATTDTHGTITYVNEQFCEISGYTREELVGQNHRLINSGTHPTEFFTAMFKTITSGEVWHGEICNRTKNGDLYWVLTTIVPFLDDRGKPSQYIAIRSDITQSKKADTELKDALKEKEVLLKEVYHRVKNNLQIVSSLINLQTKSVRNKEAVVLLIESANRIKSMALLHEKLYQSEDLAEIDFKDYVRCLVDYLIFGYGISSNKIKVVLKINQLSLDMDTAIPCGLIINELVSNALKYAFPDDREGEISIAFSHDQDGYCLVISDNGIGVPDDIDIENSRSLGLQLVSTLTNQLMGSLTLDKADGATFRLRFNNNVT